MSAQLRKDIVSGDWIIISPKRNNRPRQFNDKKKREISPVNGCPFEDPSISGHETVLTHPNSKDWKIKIIKNKFPVFEHIDACPRVEHSGPYSLINASGYHDVIIARDHDKNFPNLSSKDASLLFKIIRDRYLMFGSDKCVDYVSIFHNWGPAAGASIYHPHYQMIALQVIPPDVNHSLLGSANYFREKKSCVHCDIINWEMREGNRVIYENEGAIVFAPFFSREPYETRIFPKKHLSYFEDTTDSDFAYITLALQETLRRLSYALYDPDYNFFIHTAPIKNKENYSHYHWHIEILPKTNINAGFELGTGIEINPVDPDDAASVLK